MIVIDVGYAHRNEVFMTAIKEKRRHERLPVDLTLNISKLFKQNNDFIKDINAPIHVTNISKSGIGFESDAGLPIGYYFNAKIDLGGNDSSLYTVVQIVRKENRDTTQYYGCEFIGMAPVLNYIFDNFKESLDKDN